MDMSALKDIRNDLGFTPAEMAELLGISYSLYIKVEGGIREPSRDFLIRLKEEMPQIDINKFFKSKADNM